MSPYDELNALEEAEAEELSGQSILNLGDREKPKTKILGALAYVHRKRTEPNLRFSDFMRSTDIGKISDYLYTDPDEKADEESEPDPFPESEAPGDAAGAADAEGPVHVGDGSLVG